MARAGRSWRRVPRPLAGLLLAVGVFGVAWALVMPPFQGPDEIQHFSYVETLAQQHKLPGRTGVAPARAGIERSSQTSRTLQLLFAPHHGPPSAPQPVSSGVQGLLRAGDADSVTVGLARPEQSRPAFDRWLRSAPAQSQTDGGGSFPGSEYPPLYYGLETIGYLIPGLHANVVDHLYAARLFSVIFLLLTTIATWMLAGELTRRHRPTQLIAAAAVGLWPMLSFISSMVNPDALLYASWTWAFWAMAVIVNRGLTAGRLALLAGFAAGALLAKATSVALMPAVAAVLLLGFWRLRRSGRRAWLPPALVGLAILGIPVGGWILLSVLQHRPALAQASAALSGGIHNVRGFATYVWEYYLPRLPGQAHLHLDVPSISSYPAYNVWVATSWGAFGWVTLYFPRSLYPWFLGITVVIGLAALARAARWLWAMRRTRRLSRAALPLGGAFGLTALLLLLGLHVTEYQLAGPVNQGRYLFPLAAFAGLGVALAVRWLPRRLQPAAGGLVVGALVVFQLASLGYVGARFYA